MWIFSTALRAAQPSPPQSPKKPGGKPQADRIDYRDILSPEDFQVYSQLRDLRAVLADKENVARFLVCTNAQLAAMVTSRATTQAALGKIQGFGTARVEKYGAALLEILTKAWNPTMSGPSSSIWAAGVDEHGKGFDFPCSLAPAGQIDQHDRVIRGGNWNNNGQNCRSAYRNNNTPDNRNNNLGFRVAAAPSRNPILPDGTDHDPVPRLREQSRTKSIEATQRW